MTGLNRLRVCLLMCSVAACSAAQDEAPAEAGLKENRLALASSPYLRQHRHNPVDWHPWGEEALALAARLDKPIFLSIGYSACHWCHVMARESFMDADVAAVMNEHFVCIKVDREERPDIDKIYMGALQAMGRRGGWPLSAWLTPDGKPFYGGTYFPPKASGSLPAFRAVCEALARAWRDDRAQVTAQAGALSDYLARELAPALEAGEPDESTLASVLTDAQGWFDPEAGGFGAAPMFAPKFPQTSQLRALMGLRSDAAMQMVAASLDAMRRGGIHDQLGGGFHRYSTDRQWRVPHFEKMLYSNAQLASCYLRAGSLLDNQRFLATGRRTLDWLLGEMGAPSGAFWSSRDAQSNGVEGLYFVWQKHEIDEALGDEANELCVTFGVTEEGNWDGRNVLVLNQERPVTASFTASCAALLAVRGERVKPATDDKILVAWNGLAIEALCDGFRILGDGRYLRAAQRAAGFLCSRCVEGGRVRRGWQGGEPRLQGYLDDHAALANALLSLFECDGDPLWLERAAEVLAETTEHFAAEDGSFYYTADDHEQLLARTKSASEGAMPSGVAMAARALLRAGLLLGDSVKYERGVAVLRAHHVDLSARPTSVASLVCVAQLHLAEPREVVVVGPVGDPRTEALLRTARQQAVGRGVVAHLHDGNRAALVARSSVFEGKADAAAPPRAYVCRQGACEAPVYTASELAASLGASR